MDELRRKIEQLENDKKALEDDKKVLVNDNQALEKNNKALEDDKKALNQRVALTTLHTFLRNCHNNLSVPLRVPQRTKPYALSTLTSPKDRCCPKQIKEWKDFNREHRKYFDRILAVYYPKSEPPPQPFPTTTFITELGETVQKNQVISEADLRVHERTYMEDMVTRVMDDIIKREALDDYDLGQGVAFQNHLNNLSTGAPEVQARLEEGATSSDSDSMPKPTNADQISVVKRSRGGNTVSFLIEYKSPYKLPKEVLREGIRPDMKLEDIINRATYSTDAEKRFTENAEVAVAAVITQLYSYMLQAGIEFGYSSTGEIYLFLQIRHGRSEYVYYHLAEPNVDFEDMGGDEALAYSAVSQVLCFCLRASKSARRSQNWRRDAKTKSLTWAVNEEKILAQMTPIKDEAESPHSEYKSARGLDLRLAEGSHRNASPRPNRVKTSRETCEDDQDKTQQDSESSSDDQFPDPESPSARPRLTGSKATEATKAIKQKQAGSDNAGEGHKQRVPYCTHRCLQGVLQRGRLDSDCPNRALHPSTKRLRHTIDAPTLCTLLRNQLDSDMDHNCTPLDIQGARGALFKLTLATHGYTFVGKGTVRAFVRDLRHEGRIYRRLRTLQGTSVPICLGNIDCIFPFFLDIDVEIIHFLLLSWAGVALDWDEYATRKREVMEMEYQLRTLGVKHEDVRCLNVLRDQQHGQLMLIDFERATLSQAEGLQAGHGMKGTKVPLGEVSSNVPMKRRWEVDATGDVIGLKVDGQAPGDGLYHSLSI